MQRFPNRLPALDGLRALRSGMLRAWATARAECVRRSASTWACSVGAVMASEVQRLKVALVAAVVRRSSSPCIVRWALRHWCWAHSSALAIDVVARQHLMRNQVEGRPGVAFSVSPRLRRESTAQGHAVPIAQCQQCFAWRLVKGNRVHKQAFAIAPSSAYLGHGEGLSVLACAGCGLAMHAACNQSVNHGFPPSIRAGFPAHARGLLLLLPRSPVP